MQKYLLCFLVSFFLFSCTQKGKVLNIATATNMQFAMQEIADHFTQKTGIKTNLIISSSGKLTAQIKEGAPYDVFVSANVKYPEEIYNAGLSKTTPKIYAYGSLVLWSANDNIKPSLAILETDSVKHIATANPSIAPYGTATQEVLEHYNLNKLVKDKLVFGESIAQTNQFIVSSAAEVGFTAKSVVLSEEMKDKGNWIPIESSIHKPIAQGVVLLNQRKETSKEAFDFYTHIFSNDCKNIFQQYGYRVIPFKE